ncbi:hypothetical protein [Brevibacterium sp. UBA7493]|uniref:hypothetical protein n=1 Tax=Brevibacterium sp. UBA7493 TaxID=1946121 RepID=UPI0025795050|nr:hypothetical protein [Brevibacterium sp. UBA7493]
MAAPISGSAELFDRINRCAREQGLTPVALIERLLDDEDRRRRIEAFGRAMRNAPDDYWGEFSRWEAGTGSPL